MPSNDLSSIRRCDETYLSNLGVAGLWLKEYGFSKLGSLRATTLAYVPAGSPGNGTEEQGKPECGGKGPNRGSFFQFGNTLLDNFVVTSESPRGHSPSCDPPEPGASVRPLGKAYGTPKG